MRTDNAGTKPAHVIVQLAIFECDHPHFYALVADLPPKRRARKIRNVLEGLLSSNAVPATKPQVQSLSHGVPAWSLGKAAPSAIHDSTGVSAVDISDLTNTEVDI